MDTAKQISGVQELYRPADGNAEVDIVAVHGLNGNAVTTWTARAENICWLNHPDFLPKYIQNARVLVWGYNANVSSIIGPTSSNRILQHAQTLVHQLEADRDLENASARPIIFVCHSLGGIIVKRAIAYSASRKAPRLAHIQSIYTSTYAVLFFGTPHHGSSKARLLGSLKARLLGNLKARLLGSLQKVVRLPIPSNVANFENGLVDALKEQSEILQNINDQFAPLMAEFHIYFFWEQEKTDLKYTKDYVVEEPSAAPILDNTERCGIAADHREMCKFDNNCLQGFRTAISALRRYARGAPEAVRLRHKRAVKVLQENQIYQAADNLRGIQSEKPWLDALNTINTPRLQAESALLQRDNEPAGHIAP